MIWPFGTTTVRSLYCRIFVSNQPQLTTVPATSPKLISSPGRNLSLNVRSRPLITCLSGSWQARATTTDDAPDTATNDAKATPSSSESSSRITTATKTASATSQSRS